MKLQLKILVGATEVKINGSVMEVGHIVADIFFALFFIGKEQKRRKDNGEEQKRRASGWPQIEEQEVQQSNKKKKENFFSKAGQTSKKCFLKPDNERKQKEVAKYMIKDSKKVTLGK